MRKNESCARILLLTAFSTSVLGTLIAREKSVVPDWPRVQALTKEYHFPDALRAVVDLNVIDTSGRKIYVLHCRPGALILKSGKAFTLPNDADFWGDFDCHLHSLYSRDKYESLLIDNPYSNDESHSRGEFYYYEFQGTCSDYPEWGRKRSFRLRGMRLQLELFDIHFAADPPPGRLASFGFKVEVIPDPLALSAISEPPAFMIPTSQSRKSDPRFASCDSPVPQHVPGIVTEEYVRKLGLGPPYPVVEKMTKKLQINPSRAGYTSPEFPGKFTTEPVGRFADVQINDRDGKPSYDFECVASRIVAESTPQIAGDGLTCGLFMPGNKTNLLLDSVDPSSRMAPAVILAKQLRGPVANDPEWGNRRHFGLRGFSLTLTFTNPVFGRDEFGNPTLVRSDLTLQVEPDPSAQSPVADPPKTAYSAFLPSIRAGD
jgi:hypothetical protein